MTSTVMKNIEIVISEAINNFVSRISEKYNIDEDELLSLWDAFPVKKDKSRSTIDLSQVEIPKTKKKKASGDKKSVDVNPDEFDIDNITKYTVPQLKVFCKAKQLGVSGKKQDLIDRLLKDSGISVDDGDNGGETKKKSPPKKSSATKTKKVKEEKHPPIPVKNGNNFVIKKNKFNNFEHEETKLLFNNKTKSVIGKQLDDGTIEYNLTEEDIDNCHKFKFKYTIPDNLDSGKNTIENIKSKFDDDLEKIEKKQQDDGEGEEDIEDIEDIEEIEEEIEDDE